MKGYVRKYDDNARKRRRRGQRPQAEKHKPDFGALVIEGLNMESEKRKQQATREARPDFGQMSVDALNQAVREKMAAREKRAIENSSGDAVGSRRGDGEQSSTT